MPPTPSDRIEGGVLGLLVGDALGVPFEFKAPSALPATIDFALPPGFPRSHAGVPVGTWSDDGAMALCLLASLLHCGRLDTTDLGNRFVAWLDEGYMAVENRVFDVGNQTARSLRAIRSGVPADDAGGREEHSNGNGSLMRVLPLALWHQGTDAELIRDAHAQSRITHAHPRCEVVCALYCLWTRGLLAESADPWTASVATLQEHYQRSSPLHLRELRDSVLPDDGKRGSGYVVHTLHSTREALTEASFRDIAVRAVKYGEDTDTTAAVAGGLAGVMLGKDGIPAEWRSALRGRDVVDPLLAELVALRG